MPYCAKSGACFCSRLLSSAVISNTSGASKTVVLTDEEQPVLVHRLAVGEVTSIEEQSSDSRVSRIMRSEAAC